jgi:predicted nucleotidyltransferase
LELTNFLDEVTKWAEECPDIVGLALVGSHARGAGRIDSDIDLVVLCVDPSSLIDRNDWIDRFGEVLDVSTEDYGAVRSLRVFYQDGLEVEFGINTPTWVSVPLDAGTRQVISDGIRILYDPKTLLYEARKATAV